MKFSQLILVVDGANVTFDPYDRGQNGSFVYRKAGVTLHSPRLVVETKVDDNASDKYLLQVNTPRVLPPIEGTTAVETVLGTDFVKTELRFLATTKPTDRTGQIDLHIAALQELRETFGNREKMYS